MFKIVDGRTEFYQWDTNRQIKVEDNTITELHFCNRTDDCSLVVQVVNGVANVPNVLLQESYDIRVYGFCADYTKVEKRFKVVSRTKPSDYVYTETEIKNYEDLEERINTIGTAFTNLSDRVVAVDGKISALSYDLNEHIRRLDNELDYIKSTISSMTDGVNNRFNRIENEIGDIETALNEITTLQESYIGG